jgi:antibiotic biosynthesis monooxygenase (ABM) superfamily enzyme
MIASIWHGRTSRADAANCQQYLDGQASAVMARGVAGLRSIDILRRDVADDEVEFTTILMFDDWAAVDAFAGPDRTAAVIPGVRTDRRSRLNHETA